MFMNQKKTILLVAVLAAVLIFSSRINKVGNTSSPRTDTAGTTQKASTEVANAGEMAEAVSVGYEGMSPVEGSGIIDGIYPVEVDSSSSMFKITRAELKVENGSMSAIMTMGGTGYLKLFMGTGEQAAGASEDKCIPFSEDGTGAHTFTIPVEALDKALDCAAFSKKKEKWYERTLVFRVDSLPVDAFKEGVITTTEDLALADGTYSVETKLYGGSGRTGIASPATLSVNDGRAEVDIVWDSPHYDYMKIADERYDSKLEEGHSVFTIPVNCFDWNIGIIADTTAMSEPHEIAYSLRLVSSSITPIT